MTQKKTKRLTKIEVLTKDLKDFTSHKIRVFQKKNVMQSVKQIN